MKKNIHPRLFVRGSRPLSPASAKALVGLVAAHGVTAAAAVLRSSNVTLEKALSNGPLQARTAEALEASLLEVEKFFS